MGNKGTDVMRSVIFHSMRSVCQDKGLVLHGSSFFLHVFVVPAEMRLISRELLSQELLNGCAQEYLIPASIIQLEDN